MPKSTAGRLERLSRLARSKAKWHPGILIFPHLALRIHARAPVAYAKAYFRAKLRAAFSSPLAADFDFIAETPTHVRVRSRVPAQVVAAIQDELDHYHLYLSNFLTHPRYGREHQVGFNRGDTLEPVDLRENAPGTFEFRVRGVVVGRRDLLRWVAGPNKQGPPAPPMRPAAPGATRIFITMPTRPDAPGVGNTEWYDFLPNKWRRAHPHIPLRPPIPISLRPRHERALLAPRYEQLFRDGVIRIAFLYGYDDEGHNTTKDARDTWEILTAPPTQWFRAAQTGRFGYHGTGLGFSDPTGGHFHRLNLDGTDVFRRGSGQGAGPVRVRYRLGAALHVGGPDAHPGTVRVDRQSVSSGRTVPPGTVIERDMAAEIRLYNFDKSSRLSSTRLIEQFVSAFKDNSLVLYDGHANYGGGFFIGRQPNDILWAQDIGKYVNDFSPRYQIFAIGACHGAGYFADLFYNELRPRKTPRNLDVVAAVNETAFLDSVHQMLALVRGLLQLGGPEDGQPLGYDPILLAESPPRVLPSVHRRIRAARTPRPRFATGWPESSTAPVACMHRSRRSVALSCGIDIHWACNREPDTMESDERLCPQQGASSHRPSA